MFSVRSVYKPACLSVCLCVERYIKAALSAAGRVMKERVHRMLSVIAEMKCERLTERESDGTGIKRKKPSVGHQRLSSVRSYKSECIIIYCSRVRADKHNPLPPTRTFF